MNTLDQNQLIALAADYRQANANNPAIDFSTGFVIVYDNEVCGWSLEPDPSSWMPGTFAISPTRKILIAVDGNDYDGAEIWEVAQPEQPQSSESGWSHYDPNPFSWMTGTAVDLVRKESDNPTPQADAEPEAKALIYIPDFAKHTVNHHSERIDGSVVVIGSEVLRNLLTLVALESTTSNLRNYIEFLARDLQTQIDRHDLELFLVLN
ncbi:hypothetical protein [Oceanobacter mangrovi]|uniref:hypothetical protein n=1 Tax=Oceanobacter mangrovi TaxID=2862510 RepID=UPI001C8DC5E5|nr:hypothetical protein [Oceanobacter mangrovi]